MSQGRTRPKAVDHRSLVVWQVAMELATLTYATTSRFPAVERFGLSSQLRRSAVSVPANIAEGNGRIHRREYLNHLSIARGSLRETSTLFEVAKRIGYMEDEELETAERLIERVGRMLTRLIAVLRKAT